MSDYNSGLPVRSEADGTDERLHVKVVDGTTPSRRMTVDADGNSHVEVHGNKPDGADVVETLTEEGRSTPRGDYNASTNTKPASAAIILHARNASPTEANQTVRQTGIQGSTSTTVYAADVAIRDEAGEPFSISNPLPVTFVDSEGAEINDYSTSVALAAAGTSNHDYTVTALKTLKLAQINATATGKLRVEIQTETAAASGVFTTKFVAFNSTANPNINIDIKELISQVAGAKIRVIRTNKDNQAQDVYSTISGHEIP